MEDIREKFHDCASQSMSEATVAEVLARLDVLEEGEPISGLADLLRGRSPDTDPDIAGTVTERRRWFDILSGRPSCLSNQVRRPI